MLEATTAISLRFLPIQAGDSKFIPLITLTFSQSENQTTDDFVFLAPERRGERSWLRALFATFGSRGLRL
jgi:hypothetical protein